MPARPVAVAEARRAVTEVARAVGAGEEDLARVRLAVSEAVTNAVLHAYVDAPSVGEVEVEACRSDRVLDVTVRDFGRGMRPRPDSPGLGLGLPLIAQLTDQLDVRSNGCTALRMRFELAG